MGMRPGWVGGLVEETFFVACSAHESRKKNEKNIFCLACRTSICPHCAPAHRHHPLIQVRRYVYNDVVRLDDLERLIDCSFVQPYTINSAKVIFLKPRPQSRPFKGSGNVCLTCDRILQEPFHFCCLSCKACMHAGGSCHDAGRRPVQHPLHVR
uniref:B box-type domain-containing protein n=1 Tax=Aegilops tauschii subsp. strangulata TaxID=200361 RepID=A0A453SZW7_AEGTS